MTSAGARGPRTPRRWLRYLQRGFCVMTIPPDCDCGISTGWRHDITGLMGGRGIQEFDEFIFDNFESGDQIFLCGFSLTATAVRISSAAIQHFCILPKAYSELVRQADTIDRNRSEAEAKDFVARHFSMRTRVRFLGVWDMMAALDLPIRWLDVILFSQMDRRLALS